MKRSILLVSLAALAIAAGCDDPNRLRVLRFVPIDRPTNACVAKADDKVGIARGTLDVAIAGVDGYRGYVAAPVVENNLEDPKAPQAAQFNSVELIGANVDLIPATQLASLITASEKKFFVPASGGLVTPGSSAALLVEVLPGSIAAKLAAGVADGRNATPPVVIARVTPVARFNGEQIVGAPSDLPIEVCKHCLTDPPQLCPPAGYASSDVLLGGCNPAQDQPVTCCVSGRLLCGEDLPLQQ